MLRPIWIAVSCLVASAVLGQKVPGDLRLEVTREDGTAFRARVTQKVWRFEHPFGVLRLRPADVDRIEFVQDGRARVVLRSGDVLTGKFSAGGLAPADPRGRAVDLAGVSVLIVRPPADQDDPAARSLRDGLLLHYAVDSAPSPKAPVALDLSGHSHHGDLMGVRVERVDGRLAFAFDGEADSGAFLRVRHTAALGRPAKTGELSLAMWIKVRSEPAEFPVLVCKGGNHQPAWGGFELHLNTNPDNDLQITSGVFTAVTYRAFGKWIDKRQGQWIHVGVTVDRDGDAIFYVDGKATQDTHTYGTQIARALGAEQRALHIGGPDPGHHTNRSWFDGWMDEVRIYDRALSAKEMVRLHAAGR